MGPTRPGAKFRASHCATDMNLINYNLLLHTGALHVRAGPQKSSFSVPRLTTASITCLSRPLRSLVRLVLFAVLFVFGLLLHRLAQIALERPRLAQIVLGL